MHILIDKGSWRMIAAAGTRKWANLVAYVDYPQADVLIVDSQERRTWSSISPENMAKLYSNMSGQQAPEYGECISQLSAYAETWPAYPKSEHTLEVQAEEIWQAEQADKTAEDRVADAKQDLAIQQEAHQATITMAEKANAALSPEEKANAAASRSQPAEKASRSASEPQARPQQGATKKIWDIADDLLAAHGTIGDIKSFRKQVIERAKTQSLNEGTAATQFGHWKRAKGIA